MELHKHKGKHNPAQDIKGDSGYLEVGGCECGCELHKKYFTDK